MIGIFSTYLENTLDGSLFPGNNSRMKLIRSMPVLTVIEQ